MIKGKGRIVKDIWYIDRCLRRGRRSFMTIGTYVAPRAGLGVVCIIYMIL